MLAQPSWTMYKRLCWWPYKNLKITWAWIWLVGNCHRGLTLGWRRGNHGVRHDALKPEACFWRPYYFRFDGSSRKVVHSSMHTRHLKRACLRPFTRRKPISYTTLAAGTRRILASRVTVSSRVSTFDLMTTSAWHALLTTTLHAASSQS